MYLFLRINLLDMAIISNVGSEVMLHIHNPVVKDSSLAEVIKSILDP